MPDQDIIQDIIFKIKADNKEAVAAFESLRKQYEGVVTQTQKLNDVKMRGNAVGLSFNRIVQDSAYFANNFSMGMMAVGNNVQMFAEQLGYAKQNNMKFTDVLKSSITGLNGWMLGINLAISAVLAFTIANGKAKEEVDSFTLKNLIGELNAYEKSLRAVAKELSQLNNIDLKATLEKLNEQMGEAFLKQFQTIATFQATPGGAALMSIFGFPTPEEMEKEIKKLSDAIGLAYKEINNRAAGGRSPNWLRAQIKELEDIFDTGDKSVIPKIKSLKKELESWTDLLKDPKNKRNFIADSFDEMVRKMRAATAESKKLVQEVVKVNNALLSQSKFPTQLKPVTEPNKPVLDVTITRKQLEEYYKEVDIVSKSAAMAIQDTFMDMWRDIFGEANSLFEKFLQNVLAGLSKIAAESLAESIFDTILGFINPVAGLAAGAAGRISPTSSGTTIINVQVGDQTVTQLVADGYIDAKRLRKIT